MKILITGSKGLIGTALKHKLTSLGVEVLGFDHQFDPQHSEYGDILETQSLFSALEDVDGVVHLAAVSRVIFGEKNPTLCWKTNVEGTQNIVDAAAFSTKNPWILYASSREVYGQQETLPVHESAPFSPVNIYGESKIEAEKIIEQAKRQGLATSIVRFSNVYGSVLDHYDRVVPAFCRAAALGNNITVEGKDNLFDFTYIEDVIQGVLPLIYSLVKGKSTPPIHLTSGQASSLGEIAQIAKNASPYPLNILDGASRSFDVAKFWGDTKRAQKMLNWKSCVNIREGMHRLINQYTFLLKSKSETAQFQTITTN